MISQRSIQCLHMCGCSALSLCLPLSVSVSVSLFLSLSLSLSVSCSFSEYFLNQIKHAHMQNMFRLPACPSKKS